jgi:hypothetical protein
MKIVEKEAFCAAMPRLRDRDATRPRERCYAWAAEMRRSGCHDPVGTLNENKGLWQKRKRCNALPARTRKALFLKRFLELTLSEQR